MMPPAKRGAPRRRQSARQAKESPQSLEEERVSIEIESLADFNESINWMIYGPSGAGKTVLAGGAPNATFLSTEKGVVSAQRTGSKASLVRAPTWEHVVGALDVFDEKLGPDDWVIIDSHTKMQMLYIRWILRKIHEQNESRDLDIPAIQDHQKWQNGFMRFTDRIVDAAYNSIFICTEMIKEDEEGEDIVLPQITGKNYAISNYCRAQMDVVCYYDVVPQKKRNDPVLRRALFQPYPPYVAKDRYNVLGRWQDVEEGDYTAMADFIEMIRG